MNRAVIGPTMTAGIEIVVGDETTAVAAPPQTSADVAAPVVVSGTAISEADAEDRVRTIMNQLGESSEGNASKAAVLASCDWPSLTWQQRFRELEKANLHVVVVSSARSTAEPVPVTVTAAARQSSSLVRQASSLARQASNTRSAVIVRETSNNVTLQVRKNYVLGLLYVLVLFGLAIGLPHAIPPTSVYYMHAVVWPVIVLLLPMVVFSKACPARGTAFCAVLVLMPAPFMLFGGIVRVRQPVTRGVSAAAWARQQTASPSDGVVFLTDGHVASELQIGETVYDSDGEHSTYRGYAIAPVFPSAACVQDAPPCEVAFYLIVKTTGCAGCAGNATHAYCKGGGAYVFHQRCSDGGCSCDGRLPVRISASDLSSSCTTEDGGGGGAGGLCLITSTYTCGGSSLGNPLDNDGKDFAGTLHRRQHRRAELPAPRAVPRAARAQPRRSVAGGCEGGMHAADV